MKESKESRIKFYSSLWVKLEPWQKKEKLFHFGGERFDFETLASHVGPGWSGLLEELVAKLLFLGWQGEVYQVKEKFGGLRFYTGLTGSKLVSSLQQDAISAAESASMMYCEQCGDYARLRGPGWLQTLCNLCAFKSQKHLSQPELDYLLQDGEISKEEAEGYKQVEGFTPRGGSEAETWIQGTSSEPLTTS